MVSKGCDVRKPCLLCMLLVMMMMMMGHDENDEEPLQLSTFSVCDADDADRDNDAA